MAELVDTYGSRRWGTESLEKAIDHLFNRLKNDFKLEARKESVPNFLSWHRGHEHLTVLSPRPYPFNLTIIGLGRSIPCNVTAEVLVVKDYDDLEKNKDKVNIL